MFTDKTEETDDEEEYPFDIDDMRKTLDIIKSGSQVPTLKMDSSENERGGKGLKRSKEEENGEINHLDMRRQR